MHIPITLPYSVLIPVTAASIFGGLGQNILPSTQQHAIGETRQWKDVLETEKGRKGHKSCLAESPSVFFFLSCHSLHLLVIARVRRSSKKFLFSWKAVPSASHEVLKGDDKTPGTHQLSALQHRVAKFQAYCFPVCRSSAPWQTIAEDCPKWWHNRCVDTASAWNRNPADFAVSCVGEAFCFAISLSAHCRNLSLVLQATLLLS